MMAARNFREGDYVDVQSQDRVWKAARVRESNTSNGLFVEYVCKLQTYGEYIKSPARVALFRTKTKGRTWQDSEIQRSPIVGLPINLSKGLDLMEKIVGGSVSATDTIRGFRGDCFFTVLAILRDAPSTDLLNQTFAFLHTFSRVLVWWLGLVPSLVTSISTVIRNPEKAYDSTEFAVASMWPELFQGFEAMLNVGQKSLRRFREDNAAIKHFLTQEACTNLEEKIWKDFTQLDGITVLKAAVEAL